MSHAPTTPKSNTPDDGTYASHLPRDVPYAASFEDAVQAVVLGPQSTKTGIRILPADDPQEDQPGVAVHSTSIDRSSFPEIPFSELPLALDDPRRIYASPVPGVNLTHPEGYLEGGAGIAPGEDEFARHFIVEHRIRNATQLRSVVDREIKVNQTLLKERMEARAEAQVKNKRIEREIATLTDQMDMETRVLNKAREKAKERREKREQKQKLKGES